MFFWSLTIQSSAIADDSEVWFFWSLTMRSSAKAEDFEVWFFWSLTTKTPLTTAVILHDQ